MLRSSIRALFLAALLSVSADAMAASTSWATALPPDAVASYFAGGSGLKVVVVPGGAGAGEAATALTDAVRKAPSVALAMPADSLGDVSKLDDAGIVAKAKALPVDLVAVVRVVDGKNGAKSAVITTYTTSGAVVSAFSAATDAPLVAKQGSSGATTTAGASAGPAASSPDVEARIKEFQDRAIYMKGYAAVDSSTGRIVSTWSVPIKGKYGEAFKGPAFYDYLGRPDLAEQYKKRNLTRGIIGGASAASMVGGLAVILSNIGSSSGCAKFSGSEQRECRNEAEAEETTINVTGMTLAIAGGIGISVPFLIDPHPVKSNERSRMVDEYNEGLAKELGLASATPANAPEAPPVRFAAGAWASGESGGLVLAGEF